MNDMQKALAFLEIAAEYGSVLGLSSIEALLAQLGDPQEKLNIIHVAGTNGKGSVCAYLTSVLTKAGYRVGTYTSPAVFDERERYAICGQWISEGDYVSYVLRLQEACEALVDRGLPHPTIFEIETALALLYFCESGCDPVILEVGMGGATDATNVGKSCLTAVFASIGRDHMGFLGESLAEIARVKAGIMRAGCAAISIAQELEVEDALITEAERVGAKLSFVPRPEPEAYLPLSLRGAFQQDNAALAFAVAGQLREAGYELPQELVFEAISATTWPGRFECISTEPLIYIDGAHNLPAVQRLAEAICQEFTNKSLTLIMGVLADKEYEAMLGPLLPLASHLVTITPESPRALQAEALAELANAMAPGIKAESAISLADGLERALAYGDDAILAIGSLSYLGRFKEQVIKLKA